MQQNHNMAHLQPTCIKIKALLCFIHASDSFRAFPLTSERGKHQQTTTGSFASLESSKKKKKSHSSPVKTVSRFSGVKQPLKATIQ